MESMARTEHIGLKKTLRVKESLVTKKAPDNGSVQHSLYDTLCSEDCEDFYNYLDWLDLASSSKTLVLPRNKHFYYSSEDFQGLEVLVNLKCLNKLAELNHFLETIYSSLEDLCYFTGCFQDSDNLKKEMPGYIKYLEEKEVDQLKHKNNNAALAWFSDKFARLFNTHADITLSKQITRMLLKMSGFTILDMTELNGKTYFCVQKRPASD